MLEHEQVVAIADELFAAHEARSIIPRLTARHPDMVVEDAYAIQAERGRRRSEAGHRVAGHKIGLTSKVMQAATGITEPDYGVIFEDQVFQSGHVFQHGDFSNVRIEVELAFILGKRLTAPATIFDVLDATSYVVPALEVLNAHMEMQGRTIVDTISDNAALGAVVTGGRPVRVDDVDLPWVSGVLYRNETIEESGVASAVLGHPAMGVSWLVDKLAQHGTTLEAGELILAGSFTRPMWVQPGDVVHAEYHGLGAVTCRFV